MKLENANQIILSLNALSSQIETLCSDISYDMFRIQKAYNSRLLPVDAGEYSFAPQTNPAPMRNPAYAIASCRKSLNKLSSMGQLLAPAVQGGIAEIYRADESIMNPSVKGFYNTSKTVGAHINSVDYAFPFMQAAVGLFAEPQSLLLDWKLFKSGGMLNSSTMKLGRSARQFTSVSKFLNKASFVVSGVATAFDGWTTYLDGKKNGDKNTEIAGDVTASVAKGVSKTAASYFGGAVGGEVGGTIGFAIGNIICPGVGGVVGYAIGKVGGSLIGGIAAGKYIDAVYNFEIGGQTVQEHVSNAVTNTVEFVGDVGEKVGNVINDVADSVGDAVNGFAEFAGNLWSKAFG